MKKLFFSLLFFFFLISPALAKDYSLSEAFVNVTVLENGLVNIHEEITYSFEGCYSFVYRNIDSRAGEEISSFSMNSQSPSAFSSSLSSGRLDFSSPVCDKKEIVSIDYSISGIIYKYEDVSELHLKLWGEDWEKPLEKLSAVINLPSSNSGFWIRPFYHVNYSFSGNETIIISASNLPSNQWLEFRTIIPSSSFSESNYIHEFSGFAEQKVVNEERMHKLNNLFVLFVYYFSIPLLLIPFLIFGLTYYLHGREPKINYFKPYEREQPTNHSPAVVNSIMSVCNGKSSEPDVYAFLATIFDLVRKKWISLSEVKSIKKKLLGSFVESDFVLKFKNPSEKLKDYEKMIYNYLKELAVDNTLSWKEFQGKIEKKHEFSSFEKFFNLWKLRVTGNFKSKDFFDKSGTSFIFALSIPFILFLAGLFILTKNYVYPSLNPHLFIFVSALLSCVSMVLPAVILGRRTEKGALFFSQWNNFKKFISDFSLIKEHPPESVKIWEEYLVYGISLGVAEKVLEAMRVSLPKANSDFVALYAYPHFFYGFNHSFSTGYSAVHGSSGSGMGGGGGFGGGGGGGGGGAG